MYCFFISLFANGKFATFGPPVIERDSRMGGRLFLQVVCGEEKGGGTGLLKGGIIDIVPCNLGRLFSSDVFLLFFVGGGWF